MKKKKAHGSYNLFDIVKEITIAFRIEFLFFLFSFLIINAVKNGFVKKGKWVKTSLLIQT